MNTRSKSFDPHRVLAVVLARGGSKSIPHKNLRALAGVPLIGRALETLTLCPRVDRLVVSTDAPEIASMALAYGAEIPFLRPAELAEDATPSLPALLHAVEALVEDGEPAGTVLLFQATSPFCSAATVAEAIQQFHDSGAGFLKSVTAVREHPHWMGRVEDGRLKYIVSSDERALRRQDLPPLYRLNGAISIYKTDRLLAGIGEEGDPAAFVMDQRSSLDIDHPEDWARAERLLAMEAATAPLAEREDKHGSPEKTSQPG